MLRDLLTSSQPLNRPRASAWLHALLALVLLWAQGMGQLHRAAHAAVPALAMAMAMAEPPHEAVAQSRDTLFGHTEGQGAECRLYDQLALADLCVPAAIAVPVHAAPCRAVEAFATAHRPAAEALYQARAPPANA